LMTASGGNKILMASASGMVSNAGTLNLTGGIFDNNNQPMTNTGQITGYGVFRTGGTGLTNSSNMTLVGGTTTVNGDVTNSASSSLNVEYCSAIFTDDVINNGTMKITNATVTYTGTFTDNGGYTSDPSDNFFTDLVIGETGYLTGGVGDNWYISNDFINNSTLNDLWDTDLAYLEFTSGEDNSHDFFLAGMDYGSVGPGYTDNFSWATMCLSAGNILNLFDGNGDTGGALYLRELLGADISGGTVSNIFGSDGLNVYYLASIPGNSYLGGLTYDLAGGGQLIASSGPVPIPGGVWLFGTGLICLVGIRRRLGQRNL
jgi:hypothetical protein